ncbi:FMVIB, related [Eimeria brunetti]|uniref:FMVIB, related n=1 Tax=Eimeria brunetti TaxID=51314 RepID=U6LIC2_9EIME|nr:FMVIB, related [Eimeria brunetti]
MAPVHKTPGQVQEFALHDVPTGTLAWTHCAEDGFVTVKILNCDINTGKAQVVADAEGASGVAAAQAAAGVLREAARTTQGQASPDDNESKPGSSENQTDSPALGTSSGKKSKSRKGKPSRPWSLEPPEAAVEAFADLLSQRGTPGLGPPSSLLEPETDDESEVSSEASEESSSSSSIPIADQGDRCPASAKQVEQQAAEAAAAAADAVSAAFISRPPFEVPFSHLWPYNAPPLPPHPMPDDSACCGTLSAAALLQLLQHRYLRDEIYTYAANVLLAVNPYKPLPHLYSAQHISLYRHWREVARLYRRQRNEDQSACTEKQVHRADSTTAIRSILDSLPGVLPVSRPPSFSADDFSGSTDSTGLNPWMKQPKGCTDGTLATPEPRHAATSLEQAFIESTANRNRPPPHPFVVAEEALRRLVGTQTSQTIVVSGQSGAGKTETSKQLMLFLTHASTSPNETLKGIAGGAAGLQVDSEVPMTVSGQRTEVAALLGGVQTLQEATELQKRIVSCNAIFESFGNAATRRNHNSSRIGRLTLLHFDSGGLLRGGGLRTYLLEAARITAHKKGDRNFHVFYQLLRGASEELRTSMGLTEDETAYRMLRPQDSTKFLQRVFSKERQNPQRDETADQGDIVLKEVDRRNFESMVEALKRADFSSAEVDELLQLLGGMLHLSNVSFTKGQDDNLQLQDAAAEEALNRAASLLGVEGKALEEVLRCRRIVLKGDVVCTRRNEQQSSSVCCSLIKFIYSRLFDHIVQRLNDSAARHVHGQQQAKQQTDRDKLKSIGILDIYGFESFGLENGLEQLCINYANERQQQLFVQQVIEEEVALYSREGVATPAVAAKSKRVHQRQSTEQDAELSGDGTKQGSFKEELEHSLLSSLPDTSALLQDLQEGVFRRLDDSCRLLAQGQPRDDTHFWNGLFTYCASANAMQRKSHEVASAANEHILFCLKGANGMQAAEAAANGTLLQHLQQEYLTSIGLVGAQQLQARKGGGGLKGGPSVAGIENELERLVANSTKSLLRQAMQQHEENQKQEGMFVSATGGGQFSSITKRFLKSVKDLSQELQGPHMQLHFIRCFIPNCQMKPDKFERKTVLHQLQHSGSLALVDILQSGFPHRMPLRTVASKLRKALIPLLAERLKEQEEKVEKLLANVHEEDVVAKERRILETLRHCNPVSARDRTLVSATLGLLPQSRPGSFICGVSLVCFKASVYGEAAALLADPGQFFKTPEDVCRLITAIQRLRWRVAVRIILHVTPTLLWLQRKAYLMRKIKEAAVTAAIRIILLRKHILRPLKESVQRRISIRHGIKALERIMLRRGLQTWRRCRQVMVVAETAKALLSQQRAKEESKPAETSSVSAGDNSSAKAEAPRATEGEENQSHQGIPIWNCRLFPLKNAEQGGPGKEHGVSLFPGRDLYSIHYNTSSPDADQSPPQEGNREQHLKVQKISVPSPCTQKDVVHHNEPLIGQSSGAEGKAASTPDDANTGTPLVTIAKHPAYTNLYVACTSAGELLLLPTSPTSDSELEERQTADENIKGAARGGSKLYGEPSTSLPCLAFPSSKPSSLTSSNSLDSNGTSGSTESAKTDDTKGTPQSPPLRFPSSSSKGVNFPTKFLPSTPIPPGKWLPRDLLHQVTRTFQQQVDAAQAGPPTVRPLSISFAHPLTADYAIVVCLIHGGSKNSNNGSNINSTGKLIAVLVDLLRRAPAGWIPLLFASHDISTCARRNSAFLQQLSKSALSPSLTSQTEHSNSTAEEHPPPGCQRPTTRSRSTMLSTIRLHPLWGNIWAVIGPSLLAVFSVNLRFLHHAPAEVENQPFTRDPPLRLLWNMPSIPRVTGMTLELADVWLTGCTYVRLAPPHLGSITGTDPVIQVLQMMPFGEVARSVEAKMQRLLLLSTADNSLLLLQWSERKGDPTTASGNLVFLDQVRLPFSVLQFMREEPERGRGCLNSLGRDTKGNDRLLRAFPWEVESLLPATPADTAPEMHPGRTSVYADSDGSTSESASGTPEGDQFGSKSRMPSDEESPRDQIGSLTRDFKSYGVAMVDKSTGRVIRALDPISLQAPPDSADSKAQVLAVTCLNSSVLASVQLRPQGLLSLCLGDEQGNWQTVGDFDLLS